MKKKSTSVLDILGISSAGLCMIHCLLFPVLSILPFAFQNNHWIDVGFACIGMFVVSKIVRTETTNSVKIILTMAICLVIIGVFIEIMWKINNQMVLIGGLTMIIGHILNYRSHSKQ